MADSAIEWTTKTWNPTVGCDKVSAGCTHCYAATLAHRLPAMGQANYAGLTKKLPDGSVNWTGVVRMLPERLTIPIGWKKPARIFVDSMSDLFHEDVPDEFIDQVFATMALTPRHTYQVLTKRPARMGDYIHAVAVDCNAERVHQVAWEIRPGYDDWDTRPWPLPNVWLGTSIENQSAADERIPLLLQTPAAVRFLSCEPLLGPVELSNVSGWAEPARWLGRTNLGPEGISWVIAGGESGPSHRPMDMDWARSLRDQCQAAGVAFFHKQNGGRTPKDGGRELDGRTWDEFPEVK